MRLGAFAATLMWISLSYSGWNAAVYVAGEVRDPRRAIPRSMLLGTLLVTALYLALNAVFVHAAPVAELKRHTGATKRSLSEQQVGGIVVRDQDRGDSGRIHAC